MTKTMNHANCPHPATSAARAKCRKAHRAADAEVNAAREAIVRSYYDNTADADEVLYALMRIDPDLDYDLDIEEIVARAR
jgi:hypothetical protein